MTREAIAAPRFGFDLRHRDGHHQSPAIRAGGLIFCSGMLPIDAETGERMHGTLTSEAHCIFRNLKLLLESAGSSPDRLSPVPPLSYHTTHNHPPKRVSLQHIWHRPPPRPPLTPPNPA